MDPLAQLKDIQLPEEIHNYPLAAGWWILAIVVIVLFVFALVKFKRYKSNRHAQKKAITELNAKDPSVEHAVIVLKWAALQYFPRDKIANIYGSQFQHFLAEQLPDKHLSTFNELSGSTLENRYQNCLDDKKINDFHQASLLWLKHALPPYLKNKQQNKELMEANT